jgi:hypothetical protein
MYYRQIDHGVTILATGAFAPTGRRNTSWESMTPCVTHLELDGLLADNPETVDQTGTRW